MQRVRQIQAPSSSTSGLRKSRPGHVADRRVRLGASGRGRLMVDERSSTTVVVISRQLQRDTRHRQHVTVDDHCSSTQIWSPTAAPTFSKIGQRPTASSGTSLPRRLTGARKRSRPPLTWSRQQQPRWHTAVRRAASRSRSSAPRLLTMRCSRYLGPVQTPSFFDELSARWTVLWRAAWCRSGRRRFGVLPAELGMWRRVPRHKTGQEQSSSAHRMWRGCVFLARARKA